MNGTGMGIPGFLPWPAGLALIALGAAMIWLGHRQRGAEVDIDRIPLTNWLAKTMIGGSLIVVGVAQLGPLITG